MTDPRWLAYARTLIGTREIVGPKHSPAIIGWARKLGAKVLGINVTDDETAWCGTFAAHVMDRFGLGAPKIAVRALAWSGYGRRLLAPRLGCILTFKRPGGGHVGFYVGEDAGYYHVLGGNQGNAVSITRIAKSRLEAMVWPNSEPLPAAKPVYLKPNGKPSEDEA